MTSSANRCKVKDDHGHRCKGVIGHVPAPTRDGHVYKGEGHS